MRISHFYHCGCWDAIRDYGENACKVKLTGFNVGKTWAVLTSIQLRFQCGFVVESAGHGRHHRPECRIPLALAKPPPKSFLPSLPEPGIVNAAIHTSLLGPTHSYLLFLCTNRQAMRNGLPCLTVRVPGSRPESPNRRQSLPLPAPASGSFVSVHF